MGVWAVCLVMGSVILHVAWNASARRAWGQLRFMWGLTFSAGISGLILANRSMMAIDWAKAWPYLAITSAIHSLYFIFLGQSYKQSGLAWTYSTARGLGLLLTASGAYIVLHQDLNRLAWIGILIVAVGVVLMGWVAKLGALSPVVMVAAMISGYSLVDSHAMTLVAPIPYATVLFLGASVLMLPWVVCTPKGDVSWNATLAGVGSFGSYALMLFAYRLGPVGPLLALRQCAPALAAVWGWWRLKERGSWHIWGGVVLTLAGGIMAVWR